MKDLIHHMPVAATEEKMNIVQWLNHRPEHCLSIALLIRSNYLEFIKGKINIGSDLIQEISAELRE